MLEIGILGALQVARDGQLIPLGGPKLRTLIAALIVDAGSVVSTDRLIDALLGESPSASGIESSRRSQPRKGGQQ